MILCSCWDVGLQELTKSLATFLFSSRRVFIHWRRYFNVCLPWTDAPRAPGQPKCTGTTEDSITLEWNPPKNDGGSPIYGYILEKREKGDKKWTKWEPVVYTFIMGFVKDLAGPKERRGLTLWIGWKLLPKQGSLCPVSNLCHVLSTGSRFQPINTLSCLHCPVLMGSHFEPPSRSPCCVFLHCLSRVRWVPFPTPILFTLPCLHCPVFAGSHFQPQSCSLWSVSTVLCSQSHFQPAVFTLTALCPWSRFQPLSCCCVYTDCPVSTVPFSTPVMLLCLHWLSCVHSPIFNPCHVAVFTLTVLCPQSHFQPLSCCCVYTDCPVSTVPFPTCCVYTDCPVSTVPFPTCCVYTDCPVSTVPFPTCCVYTDCPVSTVPFSTPVLLLYLHWLSCIHSPIFNPCPVRHYSSLPLPLPLLASSLWYLLLSPCFSKRFYLKHYAASFLTLVTHSVLLHYFPIIMWFIFPSKLAQKLKPLPPTTIHTSGVSLLQRFLCLLCQG